MERTIIINESQLSILKNLIRESSPLLNNDNVQEFNDSTKVGTSAIVHTVDGDPKPGKDVYSDEIGKATTNQTYYGAPRPRF